MPKTPGQIYHERGALCRYGDTVITAPVSHQTFTEMLEKNDWNLRGGTLTCPNDHSHLQAQNVKASNVMPRGVFLVRPVVMCIYGDESQASGWQEDKGAVNEKGFTNRLTQSGWKHTNKGWVCNSPNHKNTPKRTATKKTAAKKTTTKKKK